MIDARNLKLSDTLRARRAASPDGVQRTPLNADLLLLGSGNSGEAAALRIPALFFTDGVYVPTYGINNDTLAPRPIGVCSADGTPALLTLTERLVLHGDNP